MLLDNLPHKCQIQKRVRGKDGVGGGYSSNPQVVRTDVECWEQQASASEIKLYEKRGISVTRKVYFTEDPGVTEQHQIVITERLDTPVPVSSRIAMDVVSEEIGRAHV